MECLTADTTVQWTELPEQIRSVELPAPRRTLACKLASLQASSCAHRTSSELWEKHFSLLLSTSWSLLRKNQLLLEKYHPSIASWYNKSKWRDRWGLDCRCRLLRRRRYCSLTQSQALWVLSSRPNSAMKRGTYLGRLQERGVKYHSKRSNSESWFASASVSVSTLQSRNSMERKRSVLCGLRNWRWTSLHSIRKESSRILHSWSLRIEDLVQGCTWVFLSVAYSHTAQSFKFLRRTLGMHLDSLESWHWRGECTIGSESN